MSTPDVVGLVIAVVLLGYLVFALLFPEKVVVTTANWVELVALIAAIGITTPLLGSYMAKIYDPSLGKPAGDRFFSAIERPIFGAWGIDLDGERRWTTYAYSVLALSLVSS